MGGAGLVGEAGRGGGRGGGRVVLPCAGYCGGYVGEHVGGSMGEGGVSLRRRCLCLCSVGQVWWRWW